MLYSALSVLFLSVHHIFRRHSLDNINLNTSPAMKGRQGTVRPSCAPRFMRAIFLVQCELFMFLSDGKLGQSKILLLKRLHDIYHNLCWHNFLEIKKGLPAANPLSIIDFCRRYINDMEIRDLNIHFLIMIGKYLKAFPSWALSPCSVFESVDRGKEGEWRNSNYDSVCETPLMALFTLI